MGAEHDIPYSAEVKRKLLHLLALVVPVGMALLGREWSLVILIPLSILAVAADVIRVRSAEFARRLHSVFGFMMRTDELPPVGGAVRLNGASWVLISATVLAVLFPVAIAAASFAVFMVADAAAALVGRRVGRRRWPGSPRTLEGSLAFLLTGAALMLLPVGVGIAAGWTAVLAGTAAEIPSKPLNDNMRVPLVMASVLFAFENASHLV